jgi:hypothetical protein
MIVVYLPVQVNAMPNNARHVLLGKSLYYRQDDAPLLRHRNTYEILHDILSVPALGFAGPGASKKCGALIRIIYITFPLQINYRFNSKDNFIHQF